NARARQRRRRGRPRAARAEQRARAHLRRDRRGHPPRPPLRRRAGGRPHRRAGGDAHGDRGGGLRDAAAPIAHARTARPDDDRATHEARAAQPLSAARADTPYTVHIGPYSVWHTPDLWWRVL